MWMRGLAPPTSRDSHGRLDVLVNNAGVLRAAPARDDGRGVPSVLDVNVVGALHGIQAFLRARIRRRHRFDHQHLLGTRLVGGHGLGAYSTSKFALRGLTKVAGDRARTLGVRANAVCPGPVVTEMTMGDQLEHLDWDGYLARKSRSEGSDDPTTSPPQCAGWPPTTARSSTARRSSSTAGSPPAASPRNRVDRNRHHTDDTRISRNGLTAPNTSQQFDLAVVGGGMAGLTAAARSSRDGDRRARRAGRRARRVGPLRRLPLDGAVGRGARRRRPDGDPSLRHAPSPGLPTRWSGCACWVSTSPRRFRSCATAVAGASTPPPTSPPARSSSPARGARSCGTPRSRPSSTTAL